MATTYRARFLGALQAQEEALDRFYAALAAVLVALLYRYALPDGSIPPERWRLLRENAARLISDAFLGASGVPFRAAPRGELIPQSDYMRLVWGTVTAVTGLAVQQQAAVMQRYLMPEQADALRRVAADATALEDYQPPQTRTYGDGVLLRDRVIRASDETARRVTAYLRDVLPEQRPVSTLADELTAFLTPGEGLRRRNKPYGRYAAHDGLRLARNTALGAYTAALHASARLNPFTKRFTVSLHPLHKCCDHCDDIAAGGPYGLDEVDKVPPFHANCMCQIRYDYGSADVPPGQFTPLASGALTDLLLRS